MLFKNKRVYPMIITVNGTNVIVQPGQIIELPEWFKEAYSNILEPIYISPIINKPVEEDDVSVDNESELDEPKEEPQKRGRGRPKKV